MMPFHRILFPVDFSEATIAMVTSVIEMARRFDAAVTVLNAFNLVRDYSLAPSFEDTGDSEPPAIQYSPALQKLRDQRERSLDEFARRQFSNVSHSVKIEDGDPALVIQWTVQRENTDLIMMPTKGMGKFRRLLLGSVTAKVLHDVTCPVLTSAHEPQPTLTASDGLQSILCAVALSSQSDAVFRAAGFLAQAYGARICLLHIEPSPGENCLPTVPEEIVRSYERALDSDRQGKGAHPSVRIQDAAIPEGIRQTAIEEAADLVVVGRGHMQGTISQAWSHLYSIIRESPCPVLSV